MNSQKYRKAIFAVVYSKTNKGIFYVILKRKKHWKGWEFPKGKIEKFEAKRQTVRREVFEETCLRVLKIKKFKEKGSYKYHKELKDRQGIVGQTYTLFATEVKKGKISVDSLEHYSGKWVLFKDAYKLLTWPNQRKCLKIVDSWLKRKK